MRLKRRCRRCRDAKRTPNWNLNKQKIKYISTYMLSTLHGNWSEKGINHKQNKSQSQAMLYSVFQQRRRVCSVYFSNLCVFIRTNIALGLSFSIYICSRIRHTHILQLTNRSSKCQMPNVLCILIKMSLKWNRIDGKFQIDWQQWLICCPKIVST